MWAEWKARARCATTEVMCDIAPAPSGESDPRVPVRRVLLIQLRYMGDVLLCTPAVRAVRRAYPEARIEFLTSALGADGLAGNPNLDEIVVWRPGLRAGHLLRRELRGRRYDLVVDFQSTPRTARMVRGTQAPVRVGVRGRGLRNRAYTHLVAREHSLLYTPLVKMQALAPLGVQPVADLALDVVVGAAERERARQIFTACGLDGAVPVVAISAVAREPWKQWGATRWAEVADGLLAAGFNVLLTSGPGERAQVEAVVRAMRRTPVWDYGGTGLRELAALYEKCVFWIGNDGGPKHVAAAAGTRTLTVFRWKIGPVWTDTAAGDRHRWIDAPPAGGCDLRCARCRHRACLAAVEPRAVLQTVLPILAARTGDAPPLVQIAGA